MWKWLKIKIESERKNTPDLIEEDSSENDGNDVVDAVLAETQGKNNSVDYYAKSTGLNIKTQNGEVKSDDFERSQTFDITDTTQNELYNRML